MNYSFELKQYDNKIIKLMCKANETRYIFIISSIGNAIHTEWFNEYKKYFNNEDFNEIWKFFDYVFHVKDENIKVLIAHDYLDTLKVIIKYKNEDRKVDFPMEFRKETS